MDELNTLLDEELAAAVAYLEARRRRNTGRRTAAEKTAQDDARDRWRAARRATIAHTGPR